MARKHSPNDPDEYLKHPEEERVDNYSPSEDIWQSFLEEVGIDSAERVQELEGRAADQDSWLREFSLKPDLIDDPIIEEWLEEVEKSVESGDAECQQLLEDIYDTYNRYGEAMLEQPDEDEPANDSQAQQEQPDEDFNEYRQYDPPASYFGNNSTRGHDHYTDYDYSDEDWGGEL